MQFLAPAPCFQMKGSSYKAVMGRAQLNASATFFPMKWSSTYLRDYPEAGVEDFPCLFAHFFTSEGPQVMDVMVQRQVRLLSHFYFLGRFWFSCCIWVCVCCSSFLADGFGLYRCMGDISLPPNAQVMGGFAWMKHRIHKVLQAELHRLIIWRTDNLWMAFIILKYI